MYCKKLLLPAMCSMLLFSCVSNKKFKAEQEKYAALNTQYATLQGSLQNLRR